MYIERNIVSGYYGTKDFDDSDNEKDSEGNYTVWVINKHVNVVTPYTYDEAIGLAGHGPYTVGLLTVCCLSLLAMFLDIFGFSTVVNSSACDLGIDAWQQSVLLSMPFLGAMVSAYIWGYISDTHGRRFSLIIAMWGAFIATTISAFSPNWITLAALKLISVSFCSSAHSATYTLIGECCPINIKRTYLFILTSITHMALPIHTALGYAALNISFSWNLFFVTFTPWRLLILCMGLPLGISAFSLHFFHESPKFLANVGEKELALEYLRSIWKRNRCVGKKFPVEKLILEESHALSKTTSLTQSLWKQTAPLFKKPYLFRTLQLYFLNIVLHSVTNGLLMKFSFLATVFLSGISSHEVPQGMCKIIEYSRNFTDSNSCVPKSNLTVIWISTFHGITLAIINISISMVTDRKTLVIVLMTIISASSAACAVIESNPIGLNLFFTIFLGVIVNGIVSSYFIDFYPTSYRGMAACLSVMVSQASALFGSSVTGLFIISHCSNTFYVIAASVFCGVLVACFLPSDKSKQSEPRKYKKRNSM